MHFGYRCVPPSERAPDAAARRSRLLSRGGPPSAYNLRRFSFFLSLPTASPAAATAKSKRQNPPLGQTLAECPRSYDTPILLQDLLHLQISPPPLVSILVCAFRMRAPSLIHPRSLEMGCSVGYSAPDGRAEDGSRFFGFDTPINHHICDVHSCSNLRPCKFAVFMQQLAIDIGRMKKAIILVKHTHHRHIISRKSCRHKSLRIAIITVLVCLQKTIQRLI
jgi:hypothetical protein